MTPLDSEVKQAFFEHIAELRKTLILCIVTILAFFILIFCVFQDFLMDVFLSGVRSIGLEVVYTTVGEVWTTKMKVAFMAALVVSFPFTAFLLWRLLAPALYPGEKKIFSLCFFAAVFLFALGVAFAYFVVLPFTLRFFVAFGEGTATAMLTVSKYVSFLIGFIVPFGLIFLMPLCVYLLTKLGILTPDVLVRTRRYVLILLLIVAAILTPPDVVSQLMLFFPMMGLWEVGILISKRTSRRR